jgi:hypothetical protein
MMPMFLEFVIGLLMESKIPSSHHFIGSPYLIDISQSAKYVRQTVIFSRMSFPDLNALFHRHSLNYHGRIRVKPIAEGILGQVPHQIQQVNLTYSDFPIL